jgi:hypothetical protein
MNDSDYADACGFEAECAQDALLDAHLSEAYHAESGAEYDAEEARVNALLLM